MAIYSYHESNISRTQGKSACASISYITKQTIHEEGRDITHAYSARGHDVSVELYTPKNAPEWSRNLQTFWNKVEAFEDEIAEIRFKGHTTNPEKNERSLAAREAYKNTAVTAHTVIFALPNEFTREQNEEVVKRFAERYFLPRGMCVTAGFHWEKHNPHVHLQLPPRALEGNTFSTRKNRDFNSRQELKVRRHLAAEVVNDVAKENNINIHLDARSYKDQGIDLIPTHHEGWFAQKYLKDTSRIIQENREIKQENIKILFEQPQNLLKLVMGSQAVVTRQALEGEIFKRVGGDAELWAMLSHRLSSWTREMARQKTPLYKLLSQNESLKPYLSAFGGEVEKVPSQDLAERLHASLPAGFKSQISVDDLRSASEGLSQKEKIKDLSRELELLETSNTNVARLKEGHTLPSEEERLSLVNRFVDSLAEQGLLDRAGETVKGERVYTTQHVRDLEKRTTDALQKLSDSRGFGLAEADVEAARLWVESGSSHGLDSEQRQALKGLTGDTGLVVLEGPAGTGKTTVLKSVTRAYESQDYRVLGMSFQGKTAAFLGEELGISAETLDLYRRRWEKLDEARADLAAFQALPLSKRLAQNFKALQTQEVSPSGKPYKRQTRQEALQRKVAALERYDLTAKDVVFVDESYLSSSSSLRAFLERAGEKGAKAIFIGDRHQGLSIASGDLTRQARQYGESFSLDNIRRQKVGWQREASQKLYEHDLWGGFGMYQARGHVTTGSSYDQTLSHLVSDWMAHVKGDNGKVSSDKIEETLILARTNQEVETLDRRVVQALRQEGALGDGHLVSRKSEALQNLVRTSEKAFYESLSVCDQDTRKTIQQAWEDGTLTSETLEGFLSRFRQEIKQETQKDAKQETTKIKESFSSLQQASAALFAEKSENTFYEGQRVSFRSNDYSDAFKVIPPWEVGNVSAKEQKALLSLDKHIKNLDGALSSLDQETRRRALHALLEGSSELAQKAIVKSDHSPKIFGVYRDLKKIEAAPEELRKTYQVFQKTPKGVRNGQEGIFLGKGGAEGSYRVQLDQGPVIEFVPETLNPRSFEDHILRPAYAITYNRAQGLTKDAVFTLLGEGVANLLYVAGTRHREVFKAYYNGAERQDLKEALLRSEKSDYRPVLDDYRITEEERPYQVRVVGYLETAQKIQQTLRQIMELQDHPDQSVVLSKDSYKALNPDQKTLFDDKVLEGPLREKFEQQLWDQFADLKAQHGESAREIAEDLEGHRLFLNQAGLTSKTILVAAGLEAREFSPLEKLAFHKVSAYDKVTAQTRALWEEISATHPGALCYGHPKYATYTEKKQDRDLQAHALYTGQALVGEKLIGHAEAFSVINEPVTLLRRVMKDPDITVTVAQLAAHHKSYLSGLAEKESFKGYEVAHEKVVAYRQVRNFVAASFKETKTADPQLLEKRDGLAFEIFEALGQDPGITKVMKNLLSTDRDEDKLLNHAIRGEVKKGLDLYRETPDLAERGKWAAWLGSHEEGRGILRDNGERPTALLFEAKAIEAFLSTERSFEAQAVFKDKLLAWKQEDQNRRLVLKDRREILSQAVGAYQPVWHALNPSSEQPASSSWREDGRADRFFREGPGSQDYYVPSEKDLAKASFHLSRHKISPLSRQILEDHLSEAQEALSHSQKIPLVQQAFDRSCHRLLADLPIAQILEMPLGPSLQKASRREQVRALFDQERPLEERRASYRDLLEEKAPVERICYSLARQSDESQGSRYDPLALMPLAWSDMTPEKARAWEDYRTLKGEIRDLRKTLLEEQRQVHKHEFIAFEKPRDAAHHTLENRVLEKTEDPALSASLLKVAAGTRSLSQDQFIKRVESAVEGRSLLSEKVLEEGFSLFKEARQTSRTVQAFEWCALSSSPRAGDLTVLECRKDQAALVLAQDKNFRSFLECQNVFFAKTLLKDAYCQAVTETYHLARGPDSPETRKAQAHLAVMADFEKERKMRVLSKCRLETYAKTETWTSVGEAQDLYDTSLWEKDGLLTAFYKIREHLKEESVPFKAETKHRLHPETKADIKAQLSLDKPFKARQKAYQALTEEGFPRTTIAKALGCHGEYLSIYDVPQGEKIEKVYRSYVDARLNYSETRRHLTFKVERDNALQVFAFREQEKAARQDIQNWTNTHALEKDVPQKSLEHDLLGGFAGYDKEAHEKGEAPSREELIKDVLDKSSLTLGKGADLTALVTSLEALEVAKEGPYHLVREHLKKDKGLAETLTGLQETRGNFAEKVIQEERVKTFFEKQETFESRRLLFAAEKAMTARQETSHKKEDLIQSQAYEPRPAPLRDSIDLSALNEAICESVDLEQLARDFGFIRGQERSERGGEIRLGDKGHFVIDRNKNLWYDFEIDKGGNAFSMLKEASHSDSYKDKVRTLSDYTDGFVSREIDRFLDGQERSSEIKRAFEVRQEERQERDAAAQKLEKEQTAQKQAAIQDLVKKSVPLEGTQAETYLHRTRGLSGPFPESLRYLEPGTSFLYPGSAKPKRLSRGAMATLSRDKDGNLKAVQVTYLDGQGGRGRDPDGHKLPKITYGNPKGAFVDLSTEKLDPKTTPIFLAEGVETGLSIKQAGAQRVMASLGLNNLKGQEFDAPTVVLCGDWDGKPEMPRPLQEAQKVLQEKGQGGEILLPVTFGQEKKDFNDLLLEGGVEKVQDRLKSLLTVSLYGKEKPQSLELLLDKTDQNEQRHEQLHERIDKTQSLAPDVVSEISSEEKSVSKTPDPLPSTPQESPSVDAATPQKAETLEGLTPQEEYHLGYIRDVQRSYLRLSEKDPASNALSNFEGHLKNLYQKAAEDQPKIFKHLCQTEDKKTQDLLRSFAPQKAPEALTEKERSQTPQKEELPQALQEFYKAQKHQQQLTSEDNRYAHVKAMGALDEAGEALLACPQSSQALKQQDLKTYCSLVQEHASPALKEKVFREVFDRAKADSSLNSTELVKALEEARIKEADIQQESKSPYKIHTARMNRQEAEESVSRCPTSMAYLSQKDPETHQRLEEKRQQDLQRQQQKSRGLEL